MFGYSNIKDQLVSIIFKGFSQSEVYCSSVFLQRFSQSEVYCGLVFLHTDLIEQGAYFALGFV